MYGYWLRPPGPGGADHVHTCTTCRDDVECAAQRLDCPRYLGLMTDAYRCGGCRADAAAALLQAAGSHARALLVDQAVEAIGGRS